MAALAPPAQKPMGRMQIDVRLRPGDPITADTEAIMGISDIRRFAVDVCQGNLEMSHR